MDLQTFKAASMAEALGQVKRTLGSDAVILHTRTYAARRWLGLRSREVVEITAAKGVNVARRRAAVAPVVTPASPAAAYARVTGKPAAAAPTPSSGGVLETPAAMNIAVMAMSEEVGGLRKLVKGLVDEVRLKGAPQVPEELFGYYRRLIENQVAEEIAADVVRIIKSQLRAGQLANDAFVRDKLAEQIDVLLPSSGPIRRVKTVGPHVVALIGPTGVGKTTTIAKLAANLKLREGKRVGLITIDTYRIAAIDQLRRYAEIIGSPLSVVGTPEDLRSAVEAMADMDYVLIDTAGRSPNDALKLQELRNFISVAKPDEVHLVLSTTCSQSAVELAVERFGQVRVDKILFTKLDEAAHIGVVLNVVRKVGKAMSYITTGQDVPDDIEVARGRQLAQRLLEGPVPETMTQATGQAGGVGGRISA